MIDLKIGTSGGFLGFREEGDKVVVIMKNMGVIESCKITKDDANDISLCLSGILQTKPAVKVKLDDPSKPWNYKTKASRSNE